MKERDDLGDLLHRIAATVGDPPEHGLERVDARRRRRTRHRRGAVAAAVALAVSGIAIAPWLGAGEGTNVETGTATGDEPEPMMPDVVQVNCGPAGLEIPVGSIQTQRDGMHLVVYNGFPSTTDVWVRAQGWDSGRVGVGPGETDLRQPVPPGHLMVGCNVAGVDNELEVILVDEGHNYEEAELKCPAADQRPLPPATFEPNWSTVKAGQISMGTLWNEDEDEIRPATGYREELFGAKSKAPLVRVERDGDTLALLHLQDQSPNDERHATAPWAGSTGGKYCVELDEGHSPTDTTPTSIGRPPPS